MRSISSSCTTSHLTIPIWGRLGRSNSKLRARAAAPSLLLRGCARKGSSRAGATAGIASALVVGAASEQQIVADYSSMQARIPAEFWAELKERKLIEQDAPVHA